MTIPKKTMNQDMVTLGQYSVAIFCNPSLLLFILSPKYEENVKLWTSMIQSMPELKEYLNSFEDCVDIVEELNIVKAMTEGGLW